MPTLQFTYGVDTITIERPIYGYTTIVNMPFDIIQLDNGLYKIYDAGSTYDVRYCDCTFLLSASDCEDLLPFIDTTARGQNAITMVLPSGSGFFPFGPDKGDSGTFVVSMDMTSNDGVGISPWLYHRINVRLVNTGSYPSYSLPTEYNEGNLTIGTKTNIRFPPAWFRPSVNLGVYSSIARNGAVLYVDRGAFADTHENGFSLNLRQNKAAAIVNYITATARANSFNLITANNMYAFGYRSGSAETYNVRILDGTVKIVHTNYDIFDIDMQLSRESIA